MRRRLLLAGTWAVATSLAVTLSWFGVHSVLRGTVYDPPRALPVSPTPSEPGFAQPLASAPEPTEGGEAPHAPFAQRPQADQTVPSPAPSDEAPTAPAESVGAPSQPPPSSAPSASEPEGVQEPGTVETTATTGGRVAFDLDEDSCGLISATPESGWNVRVWSQDARVLVSFSSGDSGWSVCCTPHGLTPLLEIDED